MEFKSQEHEREAGHIHFHPIEPDEYNLPPNIGGFGGGAVLAQQLGYRPQHKVYRCGACGQQTNGRVLCDLIRECDGALVAWCNCSCDREEPTVIVEKEGKVSTQLPVAMEYCAGKSWPDELSRLYEEAARSYSAGAYTSSSMVCRKLLMACACQEGAEDGKTFASYVDYITGKVLTFPKAKASIDVIRSIGNEANHGVAFVTQPDAKRAMDILTYMLNTIYSLPAS